ncbi:hypothetical protein LPTSP4_02620 [Leptospira ryugenii]|uniref:Uncharacterized protein n=1 Tax=Leptospira ryugenii TaxID=1917863 RepID=A0A2P2DVV3_9LEPT|nr:hypothetical protein [Leptospira ryugenii]GBF48762.1 hypothetical protein LPTSP4_02620 [Leptospira ryugenii]
MSDFIYTSKLPEEKKNILDKIIKDMLSEINTKIVHLGINNFVQLNDDIAKIVVPFVEDKLD